MNHPWHGVGDEGQGRKRICCLTDMVLIVLAFAAHFWNFHQDAGQDVSRAPSLCIMIPVKDSL